MSILIFGGDSDMATPIKKLYPDTITVTRNMADVTYFDDVKKYIELNKPDVVINLAGISNLQSFPEMKLNWLGEEISTNLIGSFNIALACIDCGISKMIFIGSVAGKYGKPHHAGYCASKAGVISMVQSLAMEGYNAYCISPGRVDTKMREKDFPGEDKRTRLSTTQIAGVVREILEDKHCPGDNIIIRKRGFKTLRRIDRGQPWKEYLNVNIHSK